jgi:hypothetical protein
MKLAHEEPVTLDEGVLVPRAVGALALPDLEHVLRAFDEAPEGEPLAPEQEAECAARDQDLRSGRVEGVRHADVQRSIARMRAQHGGSHDGGAPQAPAQG